MPTTSSGHNSAEPTKSGSKTSGNELLQPAVLVDHPSIDPKMAFSYAEHHKERLLHIYYPSS